MKHCVLHIGQSKTGSSAIQSFLYKNKSELIKKGVLYPGIKFNGLKLDLINHNCVADSLLGLKRYPEIEAKEFFRQCSEQLIQQNCHTLLISGEHFFGGEPRVWDVESTVEFISLYEKKILKLKKFLHGYNLKIIVYLRPQVEWLESAISQVVRYEGLIQKKVYHNDNQLFELMKPVLDYNNLLELWDRILKPEKIICIPYQLKSLHNNCSVNEFMCQLGINDEGLSRKVISNDEHKSLSREYIELKKILNNKPCEKTEEWLRIHCLNKANEKNSSNEKYTISPELCSLVKKFCTKSNNSLSEKYISDGSVFLSQARKNNTVRKDDVSSTMKAAKYFYKEYYSFSAKMKRLEILLKIYLRNHVKPIHVLFHKIKNQLKQIN